MPSEPLLQVILDCANSAALNGSEANVLRVGESRRQLRSLGVCDGIEDDGVVAILNRIAETGTAAAVSYLRAEEVTSRCNPSRCASRGYTNRRSYQNIHTPEMLGI